MTRILDYSSDDSPARPPLLEMLSLAGPTVAQMASYTVMQFVDTWMLTRISDEAATAASTSGMFAFSAISLGFGVLLLVNALVSQSYGHGRYEACGRYLWQGVWFSIAFAVMLVPLIPLVRWAFSHFGHPPSLLALEISYLRIVVCASVFKLVATALSQFLLAINRPNAVAVSAAVGVGVNMLVAYAVVLGHWGMPRLGVVGAAWAQNIGTAVEMLSLIAVVSAPGIRQTFNVGDWVLRWQQMGTLLKVGLFSGLQVVVEVLAWSLFTAWVMGVFGTSAMAANTYMFRFMVVSFMPALGIGSAVTALVGRYIGRGRLDIAEHRAHLGFKVTLVYMFSCGLLFYFARWPLISLFTQDPLVRSIGATLLAFAAVYQVFDAMYIIYCGALRGAGDTFIPSMVTSLLCWLVMLAGGYAMAQWLPLWGVTGPWLAATVYGISLGVFMLMRFVRGGWKSIHLEQTSPTVPEVPPVPSPAESIGG